MCAYVCSDKHEEKKEWDEVLARGGERTKGGRIYEQGEECEGKNNKDREIKEEEK